MKKVKDKILAVLDKYSMLSEGDTVVVGVSGGADSMCLLSFFNTISSQFNLNIICAHINHGIRGEEADRDEEFVRSFCQCNNIRFESVRYNVPEVSSLTGESEEQCGRRLRYEFFSSFGDSVRIATAHNLNDCEETFLFNLARGTGLKGLTGIPPVRGNIIRPLIECSRDEIEAYLNENGIDYVTDSTNLSDDYTRNRIRHSVVPVLNEINPSFHSAFSNCISALSESENYISSQTEKIFDISKCGEKFNISSIIPLHPAVRNRLFIRIAEYYGANDISARHIALLNDISEKGGAVNLCGGVSVASDGTFLYKAVKPEDEKDIYMMYSDTSDTYVFPGCTVCISEVDNEEVKGYNISQLSAKGIADGDKLKNSVFRSRKEGDRFRFPCREHSKSLKNLFREYSITSEDRYGVPFIADSEHILWINGVGVSYYAAADDNTKNFVKISILKG